MRIQIYLGLMLLLGYIAIPNPYASTQGKKGVFWLLCGDT